MVRYKNFEITNNCFACFGLFKEIEILKSLSRLGFSFCDCVSFKNQFALRFILINTKFNAVKFKLLKEYWINNFST